MSECGQLANAILAVQAEVRGIDKGSKNSQQGYNYTSVEQMIATLRGHMRAHRLVAIPMGHQFDFEPTIKTAPDRNGNTYNVGTMRTRWLLVHEPSGQSMPLDFDMPAVEGKGRPMDKAASASASQAITYLLRSLFLLPRGAHEVDVDGRDDSGYGEAPQRPAWAVELGQRLNSERIDKAQLSAWHKTQQGAPAWPADEASAATFTKWLFEGDTTARFSGWAQQNGGK